MPSVCSWALCQFIGALPHQCLLSTRLCSVHRVELHFTADTRRKGENAVAASGRECARMRLWSTQRRGTMNNKRPMSTSFVLTLRRHRDAQQESRTKALSTRRLIPLLAAACNYCDFHPRTHTHTPNRFRTFRMEKEEGAPTIHAVFCSTLNSQPCYTYTFLMRLKQRSCNNLDIFYQVYCYKSLFI